MQRMQLGYLNFQGKGQVSRLLFAFTNQSFQDVKYSYPQFHQKKLSLGFDFPNLPYLIDGKFKITQHEAIQRYIILKSKHKALLGLNSKQKGIIDNLKGVLIDIDKILIPTILSAQFKQVRKQNYQKLKNKLKLIQKFIEKKNYLLNKLCYADFHLAIIFGYFKIAYPRQFENYPNIIRITQNFMNIPQIKQYYQQKDSVKALFPPIVDIQKFKNLDCIQVVNSENVQQKDKQQKQQVKIIQEEKQQIKVIQEQKQQVKGIQEEKEQAKGIQEEKKQIKVIQEEKEEAKVIYEKTSQKTTEQQKSKELQKQQQKPALIKLQPKQTSQKPIESKLKQYLKKVQSVNSKSSVVMPTSQKSSGEVIKPSQLKNNQSSMPWMNSVKSLNTTNKQVILFGRPVNQCLAQQLLLQYLKIQYKQVIYQNQETFNKDLSKLSLDFSALPYLIDDKLNLSSSLAIDRYIISKFGGQSLMGKQLKDNAKTQNLVKLTYDILKQLRSKAKSHSNQQWRLRQRQKFFAKIKQKLSQIQNFISTNSYAMGYLTFADFILTELSFQIRKHFEKEYSQYQFFQKIKKELSTNERLKILIQRHAIAK